MESNSHLYYLNCAFIELIQSSKDLLFSVGKRNDVRQLQPMVMPASHNVDEALIQGLYDDEKSVFERMEAFSRVMFKQLVLMVTRMPSLLKQAHFFVFVSISHNLKIKGKEGASVYLRKHCCAMCLIKSPTLAKNLVF
jgi:hypothetical protein